MEAEEPVTYDNHNEYLQEYLSKQPSWLEKSGSLLILFVLCVVLLMAFFFKYPETITCKTTLISTSPPINLVANSTGKIVYFNAVNGNEADSGQIIAILENEANYKDVVAVKTIISKLTDDSTPTELSLPVKPLLGVCQVPYDNFVKAWNEYTLFNQLQPENREIERIDASIAENNRLIANYQNQKSIQLNEIKLADQAFKRVKILFDQKVLTNQEMEDKQAVYLEKKRAFEAASEKFLRTSLDIQTLQKEKKQVELNGGMNNKRRRVELTQAKSSLLNTIKQWEQMYIIRSNYNGSISLGQVWSANQYVHQGDIIATIIPNGRKTLFGRLLMPIKGSGKVKINQMVNIALDAYPSQEFGFIKGQVKNISEIPENNNYVVLVSIADMYTTYHKVLPFKNEMEGSAEIITEKRSLLQRVFDFLRSTQH